MTETSLRSQEGHHDHYVLYISGIEQPWKRISPKPGRRHKGGVISWATQGLADRALSRKLPHPAICNAGLLVILASVFPDV